MDEGEFRAETERFSSDDIKEKVSEDNENGHNMETNGDIVKKDSDTANGIRRDDDGLPKTSEAVHDEGTVVDEGTKKPEENGKDEKRESGGPDSVAELPPIPSEVVSGNVPEPEVDDVGETFERVYFRPLEPAAEAPLPVPMDSVEDSSITDKFSPQAPQAETVNALPNEAADEIRREVNEELLVDVTGVAPAENEQPPHDVPSAESEDATSSWTMPESPKLPTKTASDVPPLSPPKEAKGGNVGGKPGPSVKATQSTPRTKLISPRTNTASSRTASTKTPGTKPLATKSPNLMSPASAKASGEQRISTKYSPAVSPRGAVSRRPAGFESHVSATRPPLPRPPAHTGHPPRPPMTTSPKRAVKEPPTHNATSNGAITQVRTHQMNSTRANASPGQQPSSMLSQTPKTTKRYEHVSSRISSITDHKPGGGNVRIFSQKPTFEVSSKIGSLANANRTPTGGNVVIESHRTDFKHNAKPRIDARSEHKRSQSAKIIPTQRLEWKAESKIGSMENYAHKPGGGNIKIASAKLDWKAESKVGSKDNITHRPGGGEIKIFNEKPKVNGVSSKIGSLDNAAHVPGGGNVKIDEYRVETSKSAGKRVGSRASNNSTENSRRSSSSRTRDPVAGNPLPVAGNKMPGTRNPLTAEQALGIS